MDTSLLSSRWVIKPGSLSQVSAPQAGYEAPPTCQDAVEWRYFHPRLRFLRTDVLRFELPAEHDHRVINCSAGEDVGLAGR